MITQLEKRVIANIARSEYQNDQIINCPIWSFSATEERKDLAGALGSLVKKGYCFAQENDEPTCGLTQAGFDLAKELGYC